MRHGVVELAVIGHMDKIRDYLKRELESDGWEILGQSPSDDWWVNEIWKVKSKWHPSDVKFEISFKYDEPQNVWEEKYNEKLIKQGISIVEAYNPETDISISYIVGGKKSFIKKLGSLIENTREYREKSNL